MPVPGEALLDWIICRPGPGAGDWGGEAHFFAPHRVHYYQLFCEKCNLLLRERCWGPVAQVSHHRMAHVGELDPYLMMPSGFEFYSHQGAAFQFFQNIEIKPRLLTAGGPFRYDYA